MGMAICNRILHERYLLNIKVHAVFKPILLEIEIKLYITNGTPLEGRISVISGFKRNV